MADEGLLQKIQGLGDLDLAALLCLITREHCIVGTEPEAMDDLVDELQLVATETFNLKPTVVSLDASTSLDDFAASILLPVPAQTPSRSGSPLYTRNPTATAGQDSYFQVQQQYRTSALSPLTPLTTSTQAGGAASSPTTTTFSNTNNTNITTAALTNPQIANVVLARDLDKAPKAVQIQALELLRTRRLFTRTSVQTAPKQFLFVAVLGVASGGEVIAGRLADHLNDFFYLAHWHDPLDGFAHLEENALDGDGDDDDHGGGGIGRRGARGGDGGYKNNDSDSGIMHRRPSHTATPKNEFPPPPQTPVNGPRQKQRGRGKKDGKPYHGGGEGGDSYSYADIIMDPQRPRRSNTATAVAATPPPPAPYITDADLATLAMASRAVTVDVDVLRYQMNLVSFLRLHRAVGVGVSSTAAAAASSSSASSAGISPTGGPAATRALDLLVRGMAALHGLGYATPALVRLAMRKVYLHRLRVVRDPAREERSVQWGTDAGARQLLLDGVGPDDVMDDVEEMVEAPV